MKLLNARTLKIEEFFGSRIPPYAILSHRWEEKEVTYQELHDEQARSQKAGWKKICKTCELALVQDLKYIWVDTCCINKQDSSELTEAINSMFNWYARSEVCYAYLFDVDDSSPLEKSSWFTRGWTLQELIAPNQVEFFNSSWNRIGSRSDFSKVILQRTGIREEVLSKRSFPDGFGIREQLDGLPVAVRMSWASGRETTREEDRSYSLLGLFGVNMPLLYGEGDRAFTRLQEEIIKETNDLTLFAWSCDTAPVADDPFLAIRTLRGVLAISPDEFKNARDLKWSQGIDTSPEFVMTNKGLRITAESEQLLLQAPGKTTECYALSLGCHQIETASRQNLAMFLVPYSGTHEECVFARGYISSLENNNYYRERLGIYRRTSGVLKDKTRKQFFIKKNIDTSRTSQVIGSKRPLTIQFYLGGNIELIKAMPLEEWNVVGCSFSTVRFDHFVGFVELKVHHRLGKAEHFVVPCWTGPNGEFGIHLAKETGPRHDIHKAAMGKDWEEMQRLCTMAGRADYVEKSHVYRIGKTEVATRGQDDTPFRHHVHIRRSQTVK